MTKNDNLSAFTHNSKISVCEIFVVVLPECSSTESAGKVVGLIQVLRKHGSCQAIFGVVASLHHLLEGFEFKDLHHWPKDLQRNMPKK